MLTTKNLIVALSLTLVGVAPGCDVAPEDEDVEMAQSPVPYDPEMREFDPSSVEELPVEDVLRDGAEDDAEPEFRFFVPSNLGSMTSVGGNGVSVFGTIGLGMIYAFGGRAGSRVDQLRIGFYLPAGHAGIHYQAGDAW